MGCSALSLGKQICYCRVIAAIIPKGKDKQG